jgi:hypothetical protein
MRRVGDDEAKSIASHTLVWFLVHCSGKLVFRNYGKNQMSVV